MSLTVVFTKFNCISSYAEDFYKLANFMKITLDTYILDIHFFFFHYYTTSASRTENLIVLEYIHTPFLFGKAL